MSQMVLISLGIQVNPVNPVNPVNLDCAVQ